MTTESAAADERVQRYAEAYDLRPKAYPDGSWLGQERLERIQRVMAVADAEQAELRARNLEMAERHSEHLHNAIQRAESAEAKVTRVEAIHRPDGGMGGPGAICVSCTSDFGTVDEDAIRWPCATIRALAGPEPEAT